MMKNESLDIRQNVYLMVLSNAGISAVQISALVGRGVDATVFHLRSLRDIGAVSTVRRGNERLWMEDSKAVEFARKHKVMCERRNLEAHNLARYKQQWQMAKLRAKAKQQAADDLANDGFARNSHKLQTSAATAPRLITSAANSVWQWRGAA